MTVHEAIDLIDAMAAGAGRWDAAHSFGAQEQDVVREHRRIAREAIEVLVGFPAEDAEDAGVFDHLSTQPQ